MATKLVKAYFAELEKKDEKGNASDKGSNKKLLEVNFNPKELSLERSVTYAPAQNTKGVSAEQSHKGATNFVLSMTLFFDTFEEGANVRSKYMAKLEKLTKPKKREEAAGGGGTGGTTTTPATPAGTGAGAAGGSGSGEPKYDPPPNVLFIWGTFRFCGVVDSLSQKYTMFLADGTPVRAEATIKITQTIPSESGDIEAGEGDTATTAANKIANDIKADGPAAALAGYGPGAMGDDPKSFIENATKLDAATAAAAEKAKPSGLSAFMQNHGTDMINKVGAAAVTGLLTGDKNALRNGVFEGALSSAGDTGLFKDALGGKGGEALDTLASGKQLSVASLGLGVSNDKFGALGGGLALGVQRDGKNLNVGLSGGAGISTPGGTTLVGVETNQTRSTSGAHSSTTTSGVGVGSSGRAGAPNTLPTVNVGTSSRNNGGGSTSGSGDGSGSGTGSGTGSATGSGSGDNTGGGAGSGRGGSSSGGGTPPPPPTTPPTTGGGGSGSGSGNPGSGAGSGRGGR